MCVCADEYAAGTRADLYAAKARHLERRYSAIRRVRGDGNCFYRAFHVSWMERLLALPAQAQALDAVGEGEIVEVRRIQSPTVEADFGQPRAACQRSQVQSGSRARVTQRCGCEGILAIP